MHHWDPCPSGHTGPQVLTRSTHCQALHPLGCAGPQPQAGSMNTGILTPQAMLDPSSAPDPHSDRISTPCVPGPSGPARPQLHVGWQDPHSARIPAPQVHHPSGPAGPQLHMEWPDPCPAKIPTPWALLDPHLAGIPAPQAWPGPSSTGSPDNRSTRLQLRLPPELQTCLRDTHRQVWKLKE
jgi:hypothetical protein